MGKLPKTVKELPDQIAVKVFRGDSGVYIAELPEFDLSTESDSLEELDFYINDLIFTYFDIPKRYRTKIWYKPQTQKPKILEVDTKALFRRFVSSNTMPSSLV